MQITGERLNKTHVIQIPTQLYDVLAHKQFDNFTLVECYKAVYGDEVALLHCRTKYGKIYYYINKLVNHGLLIKIKLKNDTRHTYLKSVLLNGIIEEMVNEEGPQDATSIESQLSKLNEKHTKYESEIQELLGEWREYDELLNEYPRLNPIIIKATERVSKDISNTIGKMRAIKMIIDSVPT